MKTQADPARCPACQREVAKGDMTAQPRCGGTPGWPELDPRYDPDETGPALSECPTCGATVGPTGRDGGVGFYECEHRMDWPDRSELWPGEKRSDFGYPRCPGCPDCNRGSG